MSEFFQILDEHVNVFILLTVASLFVIGSVSRAIVSIYGTHAREKSRREIAAYIAEGSIAPEQGERLMKADVAGRRACQV